MNLVKSNYSGNKKKFSGYKVIKLIIKFSGFKQ